MRRAALAHGIMDRPNARSSHSTPVPRGGGLAIVVATSLAIAVLAIVGEVDKQLALALLGGGIPVAWIGFKDDRGSVPARVRLVAHTLSAVWVMYVLGGLPSLQVGSRVFDLGVAGDVLGTVAIVWTLNLFNFMDGIDGIAASEAVFVTAFGGAIGFYGAGSMLVAPAAMTVAAASAGFLVWNWPPAKIFMGDVGSGYLGCVIGALAIADARENPAAPFVWLILGGVFFVDATVTLAHRLVKRERVYEAHRSHAYQWLALRWKSHRRVTVVVVTVNLFWLFPCALLATLFPKAAGYLALVALTPIAIAAIAVGAGRPEVEANSARSCD